MGYYETREGREAFRAPDSFIYVQISGSHKPTSKLLQGATPEQLAKLLGIALEPLDDFFDELENPGDLEDLAEGEK